MEIAYLDQFLISFMETKIIMRKLEKYAWIIYLMKKDFSRITSLLIYKTTSNSKEKMDNGGMT